MSRVLLDPKDIPMIYCPRCGRFISDIARHDLKGCTDAMPRDLRDQPPGRTR